MAKRVVLDALNKHRVEMIEQSVLSSPISASNPQEAQPVENIPDQEPVPVSPQVEEGQASPANPESVPVESTSTQEEKAPDINDIPEADETDSFRGYDPSVIDSSMNLPDMSTEAIDKFGFGDMSPKACLSVSFKLDKFTHVWLSRVRWAYRQHGKKYSLAQMVLYMMLSYTAKNFFYNRTLTSFQIKEDASLVRDRIADSKDVAKKLNWKEKAQRTVTLNVRYNGKVDYAVDYFRTLYSYLKSIFIYDAILDSLNSNFLQLRPKLKDFPDL